MARRKKVRRDMPITSGTAFRVREDGDGYEVVKPQAAPALALVKAQGVAERSPVPVTLYVERQTLFGDPVDLYMVERDEHGVVFTHTLSRED